MMGTSRQQGTISVPDISFQGSPRCMSQIRISCKEKSLLLILSGYFRALEIFSNVAMRRRRARTYLLLVSN
jgi:hypothetical protein